MKSMIKELWHGNIIPQEKSRINSKEMKELLGYISRHHSDLEKSFTDEQKEIFEKFHDCWSEYTFVAEFCKCEGGNVDNRVRAYNQISIDEFPYDDVVIDEAQDLGNDEIMFFKELCDLKDGHCFVFYDKNQVVIYDKSTQKFDNETPFNTLPWITQSECRLLLSQNCRNTLEIAKTAYSVIDYDVYQKMNNVSREQPSIIFAEKDPLNKISDIVNMYLQQGFKPEEITILTMKTQEKSILYNVKKLSGITIKSSVEEKGMLFTTSRRFKGLENKVVIIIDIDETCFSDVSNKKAFYVACSRATQRLSLLVYGGPDKITSIANVIPGAGLSGKGKIIIKTKTKPIKL